MSYPGLAAAATVHEVDQFILDHLPQPGPWRHQGACLGLPTGLFFPVRGDNVRAAAAKQVCARCPVRTECRDFAVAAGPQLLGVWGGTSPKERVRIRLGQPAPIEPLQPADSGHKHSHGALHALHARLEQLTGHPGQEGHVARFRRPGTAAAVASLLRNGHRPSPPGAWTFSGRPNNEGGSDLHATWRPDDRRAVGA